MLFSFFSSWRETPTGCRVQYHFGSDIFSWIAHRGFALGGRTPRYRGGSESPALAFQGCSGLSCLVTGRGHKPTWAEAVTLRCLAGAVRGAQGTAVRGFGGAAVRGAADPRCPRCCRRRETSWKVFKHPLHSHPLPARCCRGALLLRGATEKCSNILSHQASAVGFSWQPSA